MTSLHTSRVLATGEAPVRALADAQPRVYWSDRDDAPPPRPSLVGNIAADLVIVGGGFTGLWAAIQAKEEDPSRAVVLLESETIGFGASGRNGGFVDASLTHGLDNGVRHFPGEIDTLHRLGLDNLAGIADTLRRYEIEADWDARGMLYVATQPHEVPLLAEQARLLNAHGEQATVLDAARAREQVGSPTYLGGCLRRTGKATVNPVLLAWGLRRAAISLGVAIYEHSPVRRLRAAGAASGPAAASARKLLTGRSARPAPWSALAPTRRHCAPSAGTSPRSTTTCWSPSR